MNDQEEDYDFFLKAPLRTENVLVEMVSISCSQTTTWKQVKRYCVINYAEITSDRYSHPFGDTSADSEVLGFYTILCKMNLN